MYLVQQRHDRVLCQRKVMHLRQILYVSRSTAPEGKADVDAIVERSRHNNALEGVTGLLWSDGTRFLQVFEGPEDSVAATFDRIMDDPRHDRINVLSDRAIDAREFGGWTMAARHRWDAADAFDARMRRTLAGASREIRDSFLDLISAGTDA